MKRAILSGLAGLAMAISSYAMPCDQADQLHCEDGQSKIYQDLGSECSVRCVDSLGTPKQLPSFMREIPAPRTEDVRREVERNYRIAGRDIRNMPKVEFKENAMTPGEYKIWRVVRQTEAWDRIQAENKKRDQEFNSWLLGTLKGRVSTRMSPARASFEATIDRLVTAPRIPSRQPRKYSGGLTVYDSTVTHNNGILEVKMDYEDDENCVLVDVYTRKNGKVIPVPYEKISSANYAIRGGERVKVSLTDPETRREFVAKYRTPKVDDIILTITDLQGNTHRIQPK